jgi:metallophosphoesterase superfamily enzyme
MRDDLPFTPRRNCSFALLTAASTAKPAGSSSTPEIAIDCVDAPLLEDRFAFAHHPRALSGAYVLAGHLHPAAVMTGPGRQRERLACFWLGYEVGVLPAFGDFTGVAEVSPAAGDRVFVIADHSVVEVR